jgi:hypothetical protein
VLRVLHIDGPNKKERNQRKGMPRSNTASTALHMWVDVDEDVEKGGGARAFDDLPSPDLGDGCLFVLEVDAT